MEVVNVCVGMTLSVISAAIIVFIVYRFIRHIFFFKPL